MGAWQKSLARVSPSLESSSPANSADWSKPACDPDTQASLFPAVQQGLDPR